MHEYDGILEEDNVLPRWWLATLYATIVFGVGYWFYYQAYQAGPSPVRAYQLELREERLAEAKRLKAAGDLKPEALVALAHNPEEVRSGKAIFEQTCQACHAPGGRGQIGPNLTDRFWIHGGSPMAVLQTIRGGVPDKGMPPWGPQLGEERVRTVAAYVISLKNTEIVGGKAPQGTREE